MAPREKDACRRLEAVSAFCYKFTLNHRMSTCSRSSGSSGRSSSSHLVNVLNRYPVGDVNFFVLFSHSVFGIKTQLVKHESPLDFFFIFERSFLSHICHIFVTFLSHFCHIVVTFLSHFCHIFVTFLSHFCHIVVTFLSHFCHIFVTFLSHFCHIFDHLFHIIATI
jgi:hypothetical protein